MTSKGFHPPTELDWYNFETRMRGIVVGLIEPTAQKNAENSQLLSTVLKEWKDAVQRIELLEDLVTEKRGRSEFTAGLISEVAGLNSRVSVSEASLRTQLLDTQLRIDAIEARTSHTEETSTLQQTILQRLANDCEETAAVVEQHKELLQQEMEKLHRDLTERMNRIEDVITALKDAQQSIEIHVDSVEQSIPPLDARLESLSKSAEELSQRIQTLSEVKVDRVDHEATKSLLSSTIKETKSAHLTFNQGLKEVELFLDLYIPTAVQCQISDSLFSLTDKRLLLRYSQHESEHTKQLRQNLIGSKGARGFEALRAEIAQKASAVDSRRVDFQLAALGEQKDPESPNASKHTMRNASTKESDIKLLGKRRDSLASIDEQSPSQLVLDVAAKVARLEEQMREIGVCEQRTDKLEHSIETIESYTKTLHDEFDAFALKTKRKKLTHKNELHSAAKRLTRIEDALALRETEVKTLSELLADIVEYCLIVHALLDQDEDDRKSIQLTGYRDQLQETPRARPRPAVLSLDSKCSGCTGLSNSGTLSAFKIACLTYAPSPLKYRGTVFTRAEMIGTVGEVLKNAWGKAVARPPFHDLQPLVDARINVHEVSFPAAKRKLTRISASEKPQPPGQKQPMAVLSTPHRRQLSATFVGQ